MGSRHWAQLFFNVGIFRTKRLWIRHVRQIYNFHCITPRKCPPLTVLIAHLFMKLLTMGWKQHFSNCRTSWCSKDSNPMRNVQRVSVCLTANSMRCLHLACFACHQSTWPFSKLNLTFPKQAHLEGRFLKKGRVTFWYLILKWHYNSEQTRKVHLIFILVLLQINSLC